MQGEQPKQYVISLLTKRPTALQDDVVGLAKPGPGTKRRRKTGCSQRGCANCAGGTEPATRYPAVPSPPRSPRSLQYDAPRLTLDALPRYCESWIRETVLDPCLWRDGEMKGCSADRRQRSRTADSGLGLMELVLWHTWQLSPSNFVTEWVSIGRHAPDA